MNIYRAISALVLVCLLPHEAAAQETPVSATGACTIVGPLLGPSDFGVEAGLPLADASAVLLEDGRVRLYMFAQDRGIVSAVSLTTEGVSFVAEEGERLPDGSGMPRVVAAPEGGLRLFYISGDGIMSATSEDGLTFTVEPGFRITAEVAGFTGATAGGAASGATVVQLADGRYRMYFSDLPRPGDEPGGHWVKSAVSDDQLVWTVEEGVRLGPDAPVLAESAEHPFALANPDGTVTLYYGKFTGPGSASEEGLYESTSVDGLTFEEETYDVFFANDPDALRLVDGSLVVYYGQFDPAVGGTINVARCPDPSAVVADPTPSPDPDLDPDPDPDPSPEAVCGHGVDPFIVEFGWNSVLNEEGVELIPSGLPIQEGWTLSRFVVEATDHNTREYGRIAAYMMPIRDALMCDLAATSLTAWNELTSILTLNGIRTVQDLSGARNEWVYSTDGIYEHLTTNGPDENPMLKYLEEAELELKCLAFIDFDFTNPEGDNHCEIHGLTEGAGLVIPVVADSTPVPLACMDNLDRFSGTYALSIVSRELGIQDYSTVGEELCGPGLEFFGDLPTSATISVTGNTATMIPNVSSVTYSVSGAIQDPTTPVKPLVGGIFYQTSSSVAPGVNSCGAESPYVSDLRQYAEDGGQTTLTVWVYAQEDAINVVAESFWIADDSEVLSSCHGVIIFQGTR